MKKKALIAVLALALTWGGAASAQMGQQMMQGQQKVMQQNQQQTSPGRMGRGMMGGAAGPCVMGPGMMGGMGLGSGMMNIPPEKQEKFLNDTVELRKKIHTLRFDYFEAMRNPKTSPESLAKKEKEIYELRQKLYERAQKYSQ